MPALDPLNPIQATCHHQNLLVKPCLHPPSFSQSLQWLPVSSTSSLNVSLVHLWGFHTSQDGLLPALQTQVLILPLRLDPWVLEPRTPWVRQHRIKGAGYGLRLPGFQM